MSNLIKIAITGPESTGKTLISSQLADHYQTVYVPEFARIHLMKSSGHYDFDDLLIIAEGQKKTEEVFETIANKLLFSDTEMTVMKIWSEVKYGTCHPWILEQLEIQTYDLFLLMDIDLPWQPDPLREHPHRREEIYRLYNANLEKSGVNYKKISGIGEERLKNAIREVELLLSNFTSR